MYNGVGLLTPRGSGTSGYVTANKFNLRRAPIQKEDDRKGNDGPKTKKPNEDILLHKKKREIEVRLLELRVKLEDEDKLPPERVEEMLAMERAVLEERFHKEGAGSSRPNANAQETHEVARRKLEQMERFRRALGIKADAKEGEAFDDELQEQRRKEAAMRREEAERRRPTKDERRRYDGPDNVERTRDGGERRRRDDRNRSREKRKSRESLEREQASPRGVVKREDDRRSRERYEQRDDRWMGDGERFPNNRGPPPESNEGGRHPWPDNRGRPFYNQRRYYEDGPPPDNRYHDQDWSSFRGRYYDRGRYSRGRGRRYPGRGSRPYDMNGPGYYRIGEAAPERYDPAEVIEESRPDAKDRWQKVDLDAVEKREKTKQEKVDSVTEDETHRVGAYAAEYDAHGALARKERGIDRRRQKQESSPPLRSPDSTKKSPTQPNRQRRAPDHRSESASPSAIEKAQKKDAKQEAPRRSRSTSPKEKPKETTQPSRRRRSTTASRSPSPKSDRSDKKSDKGKERSPSRSVSSASRRSGRGHDRRRDRSVERRRRPSPRRYYDDRARHPDFRRGVRGRRFDSYRGGHYRNDYRRGGYDPRGRNWRSDRRHDRRVSHSRSRERRRPNRSFSRSSSSSSSEHRKRRSSSSLSKGKSSESDKRPRADSKSPERSKSKS